MELLSPIQFWAHSKIFLLTNLDFETRRNVSNLELRELQ